MRNMYLGCHAFVVEILVLVRAHLVTFAMSNGATCTRKYVFRILAKTD